MRMTRRILCAALALSPPAVLAGLPVSAAAASGTTQALKRFACNMESWWTDLDFMQRFERAAEAGFSAIEFWDPNSDGRDMPAVAALCRDLALDVVQFTGWGGPSLADRANHDAFEQAMRRAVKLCEQLDAPMFTVVGHQSVTNRSHTQSVANLRRALERVAPILEDASRTLILEPFNPVDHPGHFLNGSVDALEVCRAIDSSAIKINWDLYHMQLTEGNLVANLRDGLDQVAYVQIADVPGRHQPGTGELNYSFILSSLDKMGYTGPIGLECWPEDDDEARAVADIIAARGG